MSNFGFQSTEESTVQDIVNMADKSAGIKCTYRSTPSSAKTLMKKHQERVGGGGSSPPNSPILTFAGGKNKKKLHHYS